MRKRRTKEELSHIEEKVEGLLNAGFTPYAIHKHIGERADLLNTIISRVKNRNICKEYKFDVVPASIQIKQLNQNVGADLYRVEIDSDGGIILIPLYL